MDTTWRVPLVWRLLLAVAPAVVFPLCRLRVSGAVPDTLRHGPLILVANHISPVDPIVLTAACRKAGLAPRFMATAGVFRAPVAGAVMRRCGHIRVDRRSANVAAALPAAADALREGSVVLVYPEGRIGLDPWMWPERGKTGAARMVALSGAPVVPVAQWGSHEVLPYEAPKHLLRALVRTMLRRPVVRVRFGDPVDMSGLDGTSGARAVAGTHRIIDAIDATLAPLRPGEPELPHHIDPSRPPDLSRARPRPGRPL